MGGYVAGSGGSVRGLRRNEALGQLVYKGGYGSQGYGPSIAQYHHAMTQSPGHYSRRTNNEGRGSMARVIGDRVWDHRERKWRKLADDPRQRQAGGKKWDHRKRKWVKVKNDPRARYDKRFLTTGRGKRWDNKRRKWVKASVFAGDKENRRRRDNKNDKRRQQKQRYTKKIKDLKKKRNVAKNRKARSRYQKAIRRKQRQRRRWRRR